MKMTFVAAAVVAVAGTTFGAFAGTVTVTDGVNNFNGTVGSGGAFTVNVINGYNGEAGGPGGSATSFATFCIERNENLTGFPGATYTSVIAAGASGGGYGGATAGFDAISERTAYLYSQFRKGLAIGGYVVNGTTTYLAGALSAADVTSALQLAIWREENELTATYNPTEAPGDPALGDADIRAAADAMWADANLWASTNGGNFLDVRVLQLYTPGGSNVQDQLTIVPLPPAAWAGLGTLGCVLGFSAIRRRRLAN